MTVKIFQLSELEHELKFVTGEIKSMKNNHHILKKVLGKDYRLDSHSLKGSLKDLNLSFRINSYLNMSLIHIS